MAEDPLDAPLPSQGAVTIGIGVNERPVITVPARMYGAGDVAGLDPRQIIRTEPASGVDAEPTFFPLIEFDRPDLPWLFTPATAQAGQRLRPWIVLVVVEAEHSTMEGPADDRLPVLRCPQRELPDLRESWAWAYVQVATDGDLQPTAVAAVLTGPPERSLSRLVCPRRLRSGTRYRACVVPAFEAGRKRGLGAPLDDVDEQQLLPAWGSSGPDDEVALPVYHGWEFGAGADGDFLSLVRRLRTRPMPESLGLWPVDVSRPGYGLPEIGPAQLAAVLGFEGALRGPDTVPTTWDAAAAAAFADALRPLLSVTPGRMAPPLYGATTVGVTEVDAGPLWLRELNLDPRHRGAAATGAAVVRRNQEALMASAWSQAAAVARANEALRQAQLARQAGQRTHDRLASVPVARLLQLTGPAHGALGIDGALAANAEIRAALSPAFRRVSRPGSPLARLGGAAGAASVVALGARQLTVNPELRPAPGMVGLQDLTGSSGVQEVLAQLATPRWWELPPPDIAEQPAPLEPQLAHVGDGMPTRIFATSVDGRLFSRVDAPVAWHDHGAPPGGRVRGWASTLLDHAAFVGTDQGRVCSLVWNGDEWRWQEHGRPSGTGIVPRLLTVANFSRPLPNRKFLTGRWFSAYGCFGGQLWELLAQGDDPTAWTWSSHGAPPGAEVTGAVGGGGWSLLVHGTDGRVWSHIFDGTNWTWAARGVGSVATFVDPLTPPTVDEQGTLFARSSSGAVLGLLNFGFFQVWGNAGAPEPVDDVLGVSDGLWVRGASGGFHRYRSPDGQQQPVWQTVAGGPAVSGRSTLRGGEPWYVAAGGLGVLRTTSGTWEALGGVTAAGSGDAAAAPPRRAQWRGTIGFMGDAAVTVPGAAGDELAIGRDLGFEGEVRQGWTTPLPIPRGVPGRVVRTATALTDLDGDGAQELVHLVVADVGGVGNLGFWSVGRTAADGQVTWDTPNEALRMPTPMSSSFGSTGLALTAAYDIQGCAIAANDLDGDGRSELVMVYVSGKPGQERVQLRIGWCLDATGAVTGGWTESTEIPWPGRPGGDLCLDVGVALVDIDNDLRPELVVLLLERTAAGLRARYRIGRGINGRGRVVGGWSEPVDAVDAGLDPTTTGIAVTFADFTGSQAPDLVVAQLDAAGGAPRTTYRVGIDVDPGGTPRHWTPARAVPTQPRPDGWLAGVAVGDLHGGLVSTAVKVGFATTFRAAAQAHQKRIDRGLALARADDESAVAAQDIATSVVDALAPDRTVETRVDERLQGVALAALPAGADHLAPLVVAPSFPQAMSGPLVELAPNLLLPGVGDVPPDTVTLVRANTTFIEAFMVGLTQELGREMLWREFPADRSATYFRRFWDSPAGEPDIPPIGGWGDGGLGAHAGAVGGPDTAVLLVRGELLRRYPDAHVYARRAAWGPGGPGDVPRSPTAETLAPRFSGRLPPDVQFFGFPLTVEQARGDAQDPGWFFVLAEHPTAPRFGVPAEPRDVAAYGTAPATWEDLTWADLAADAAGLDVLRHVPVAAPFGAVEVRGSTDGPTSFAWGRSSAQYAYITLRRPVEVAVHASDMLPDRSDAWLVTAVVRGGVGGDDVVAVAGQHRDGRTWLLTAAEVAEAVRRRELFSVLDAAGTRHTVLVDSAVPGAPVLRTSGDNATVHVLLDLPVIADA